MTNKRSVGVVVFSKEDQFAFVKIPMENQTKQIQNRMTKEKRKEKKIKEKGEKKKE